MERTLSLISRVAGLAAAVVGVAVMADWALDLRVLRTAFGFSPQTAFNTALGMLAAGAALGWIGVDPPVGWKRVAVRACGVLVLALGALTLAEYIFGVTLGVDTLLFPQTPWEEAGPPGRMMPVTAAALSLLGMVLLGAGERRAEIGEVLGAGVEVMGLVTLLGFVYGASEVREAQGAATMPMSVPVVTSLGLCLLGISCMTARPGRGTAAMVAGDTMAGALARRMLAAAVVLPTVLGFLHLVAEEVGLYGPRFGIALTAALLIVIGSGMVVAAVRWLHTMESERNVAARAMRESEATLRAVLEALPLPVFIVDKTGRIQTSNRASEALWGGAIPPSYGPEEYGRYFPAWWPGTGEPVESRQWGLARAMETGEPVVGEEMEIRTLDGERRTILNYAIPIFGSEGELTGGVAVNVDITERKQADRALRREREFLRQVIDATPSLIFVKDWEGRFVLANEAIARVYGTSVAGMVGKTDADFNPRADEVAAFLRDDREVMTSRKSKVIPAEPVTDAYGRLHWFTTVKLPLLDSDGVCNKVLGVATDITQRKIAEEAMSSFNERLGREVEQKTRELRESDARVRRSERMAFIGTLSAGLGHDIGNLLLPLRTRLETLEEMEDLPGRARAELSAFRDGLDYLGRLTRGLRAMSMEVDPTPGPGEGTELRAWWEETRPLLRAVLPPSAVLDAEPPPPGSKAAIRGAALTQAVFNLVQNAGDALRAPGARPGGVGTVRVRVTPDAAAGVVRITVEDNGAGMSPEVRERCMEPFYTTKTRGRATGMGLSLVQGLIGQVGGSVDVWSEPGRGSVFTVTLPLAPAVEPGEGPRLRAVVTLADARVAAFIRSTLGGLGFDVERGTGPNGRDACLWVVGADLEERGKVEEFVGHDMGRWVVVVGGEEAAETEGAKIVRVPGRLDVQRMRRTLHEVARECGARRERRVDMGATRGDGVA